MVAIIAKITVEDIAEGIQADCRNCPLARAVTRALPRYKGNFIVAIDCVLYEPPGHSTKETIVPLNVCLLTAEAKEWVTHFDAGYGDGYQAQPVELPLNFYLPPLPETQGGK